MDIERLRECVLSYDWRNATHKVLIHCNGILAPFDMVDAGFIDGLTASSKNIGVTKALDELGNLALLEGAGDEDWILFSHDDVEIQDKEWYAKVVGWIEERPKAGLFGFGGALGLGDPDLYQKPYQLQQLARRDFISNMRDAEAHGRRVLTPTRVATLDLFAIGVKVEFLRKLGGWKFWPEVHHGLDNAICCEAARAGYETWMLPVACHHAGGSTSTRVDFVKDFGEAEGEIHSRGHKILYEQYRDVLPLRV